MKFTLLCAICLFLSIGVMGQDAAKQKVFSTTEEKNEKLKTFTKWINDNGFENNFEMELIKGQGAGGMATKDLTASDYLLRVPKNMLVFKNDVLDINGWSDWKGLVEPLMIWILREQLVEDSFYKPYIDILPEDFSEHPLMWPEEDVVLMKGTQLHFNYLRSMSLLTGSYQYLEENLFEVQREIFPVEQFTFQKYLWAYLCVTTRAWGVDIDGGVDIALVPLADMLNHKNGGGKGGMNVAGDYFVINSTQTYIPGEQVYDSYGDKSNFDLLSTYGFMLEDNEFESVEIAFPLDETNEAYKLALPDLSEEPDHRTIIIDHTHPPHEYLRVFRLALLKRSMYNKIADVVKFKGVDLDTEASAIKYCLSSLQSMADDMEKGIHNLLSKSERSANENTSLALRKAELGVVSANIGFLRNMWKQVFLSNKLSGGVPA